ncbi:hypothetical protein T11_3364 [Trichinella zimbabwensis]|uniref:Integrase catalytic domain-containing protein n=1 Tax=Trichinella zimbabwensis TaxID=268475 RepID=A0A0V1GX33_9BILA|nr:hypothetical protein T11_3364 [Trichinella zimbabwensis]
MCLSQGHTSQRCTMKRQGWKTHYLLSTEPAQNRRTSRPKESDNPTTHSGKKTRSESSEKTTHRVLLANTRGPTRIRFQTVKAIASGANGQRLTVNCLFDSGAERQTTEEVARASNLVGTSETVTVKGIGGIQCAPTVARRVRFCLSPVDTNQSGVGDKLIEALTLPRICDDIQSVPIRSGDGKHLQHLQIPEEQDEKLPVHVLMGVDAYGRFLRWVVFGPVNPPPTSQYRCHCVQIEDNMEHLLKKFWELEAIGIQQQEEKTTQDTVSCQFLDTLTHDGSRYSVGLLWKPGLVRLPDNYTLAERRLRSVERSLRKDPVKQREYTAVIEEYLQNGWAEEVTTLNEQPGKTWYLPHHAVYKIADGQTKCRVVFDGSAKYAGASLNDHLETGPNLQADLVSILLRFRQYRIAVQVDIEKMYLQVGLRAEERDACHFLWRDCISDAPPRRCRLTRVCFGLACSPYLAIKVLKAHAELNPDDSDETVKLTLANMYVDDLVMSCDKEAQVRDLIRRVPVFLKKGGFHLKKRTSNRVELLDALPEEDVSTNGEKEIGKTLGSCSTRRQMLSLTARLYDPLGYIAPFIGQKKMLFRRLWTTGLGCDAPLYHHRSKNIPYPKKRVQRIELHIFGDASQAAYEACAYIRVESINHQIAVNLVMAKSRELTLPIQEITCWSDSRVALAWIKGASARWKPFVANRENPADIPSRGCSLDSLTNSALWWHGPPWLMQGRGNWPNEPAAIADDNEHLTAEQKTVKVLTSQIDESGVDQVINPTHYSQYKTLIRVTAYCLRFAQNCQSLASERTTDVNLSVKEIWNAEVRWLREVQVKGFGVKSDSAERVREFEPFLDQDGLLRMGRRLRRSTLPPESKHPIILPHNHPVTELLIKDHHVRQMHAGVNQTLVAIRTRLWIVRARKAVKKIIRSCPVCRRVDAQPYRLRMSDLPTDRVTESPPFSHTGVDFAGPLFVRPEVQGRDTRVSKAYIFIFTCMITRAVHLELLREQTTDSFLQGLRRFISRRGRPRLIQSDNFRSFKLADKLIQCLFRDSNWERLQRKRKKFITPRAPWCGGYWERLIRSIKNALRKTLRGALLTHDELHSTLCEIEARINDRPIVLTGDNPSDRIALTPAHFLIGRELSRRPNVTSETDRCVKTTSAINRLIRRWRYQQSLTAQLWNRWKQEYLTTLNTRGKWHNTQQEPRVGDIVLVHEPGTTWVRWPIGRITAVHPTDSLITVR